MEYRRVLVPKNLVHGIVLCAACFRRDFVRFYGSGRVPILSNVNISVYSRVIAARKGTRVKRLNRGKVVSPDQK